MNSRIYDPLIGRFMSADPYIQAPDDLQSHNRYEYVMNNPLNLDDPSGYFSISRAWKRVWRNPIFKAAVGILVAIYAPQFLNYIAPSLFGAGTLATTVATGALSGFASTGTLKGALTGALTAGLMFGAGEIAETFNLAKGGIEKVALHAGAGCLSSMAGGGSCRSGAIAGALGELGNNVNVGGDKILGTVKGAMLGGIGSKLSGGKFADGATTGAFGYLFNDFVHEQRRANLTAGGALAGGTLAAAAAGACAAGSGGVCALGAPTLISGGAAMGMATGNAVANAFDQLDNLIAKATAGGPLETQYALVAQSSGSYPNVRGGSTFLNEGEVWKYGTTVDIEGRYSATSLSKLNVQMIPQSSGTHYQVLAQEKIMLIKHAVDKGQLPPGNKIFK